MKQSTAVTDAQIHEVSSTHDETQTRATMPTSTAQPRRGGPIAPQKPAPKMNSAMALGFVDHQIKASASIAAIFHRTRQPLCQIGQHALGHSTAIGHAEGARRRGGGRDQGLLGAEPGVGEERHLAMHRKAHGGGRIRRVRADEDRHARGVQTPHGLENRRQVHLATRETLLEVFSPSKRRAPTMANVPEASSEAVVSAVAFSEAGSSDAWPSAQVPMTSRWRRRAACRREARRRGRSIPGARSARRPSRRSAGRQESRMTGVTCPDSSARSRS